MQFYWKCEECDETNPYPSVKVCETCGSPMTPAAEQRVLREQKEEEKRQVLIKKEQERRRREAQRAKQEAERKRLEALKAAQQAEKERKRREQLEISLKKKEVREKKIASVLQKSSRFLSGFIRVAAALAVITCIVLFLQNADNVDFKKSFSTISNNIHTEYLAHTVVKSEKEIQNDINKDVDSPNDDIESDEKRISRVLDKVENQFSAVIEGVSSNIKNQASYLKETFKPMDNISNLAVSIAEKISGVED